MGSKEEPQIDEVSETTPGVVTAPATTKKSYSSLKRSLSEKELLNIGSVNLMIDEIDRMENEISSLKSFREQFYAKDKNSAILSEKLSAYKCAEIAYNVSISMGALLIGISIKLWENDVYGVLSLGGGIALWISGSIMKFGRMFTK
ncbi:MULTISPECIES: hypothetical protein [Serratia]|uniref:hypothetical protein n=1 Tax=Serratia TaxID=613 RepID=UPI0021C8C923|nr:MULTISPECIES: hypothetical protein [Serratia]